MEKYTLKEREKGLLSKRIIDICGEVDREMVFYVRECIMQLSIEGNPDIEVVISSGGGSVGMGLDIYDMLRIYPGKKVGKVFTGSHSMAAVILQACERRLLARHSIIKIHHIVANNLSLDIFRSKKRVNEAKKDLESSQQRIYEILSKRTGKNKSIIKKECAKDRFMESEEALEFGLIDEII